MNIDIEYYQEPIIEHYGVQHQLGIYMEECAELIQAISKFNRAYDKPVDESLRKHIIEEIADVCVCIDQLQFILYIKDSEIEKVANDKVARQLRRIKYEE